MFLTYLFIFGPLLFHTNGYVLLQVRKGDNQSNVDALIHKVVPPEQFDKIADTARKQFRNFKQFQIRGRRDDKEIESVVFAIKTNSEVERQKSRRQDDALSFEDIKRKFFEFFNVPDKNDVPNLRAKMEKYDIKPQLIHFRNGEGNPSLMYEVQAKSVLDTIKDTIMTKKFQKFANKLAQKAAVLFRTFKEELQKN